MKRTRRFHVEALESRICLDSGSVPPPYPGTPITIPGGAWTQSGYSGSPIFADLKGDGNNELLVEAAGGKMIAYGKDSTGQLVKFQEYDATPLPDGRQANFKSTPVVVSVPGIGKVIIAALGHDEFKVGLPGALEDGRVFAFNAVTGKILPGWPQPTAYPPPGSLANTGVTGALTIGYLEGNGKPDVIVDSSSTIVRAFRMDGSLLWSYANDESVEPGAVVADLNGDGRQEVILTSGMTPGGNFYPGGGYFTILNGIDGSMLRRIHTGESFFAGPVVADLFGDGRKEIIAAPAPYLVTLSFLTPAQQQAARAAGDRIYAFFPDGTPVPGWPYHTTTDDTSSHQLWKEVIAADLFGDGKNEVLGIDRQGVLHVIDASGKDVPGFAGGIQINPGHAFVPNTGADDVSTPIVADVNGDGKQDIVVSRGYYLAAYDNTGNLLWSTTTPVTASSGVPDTVVSAAAFGQFDPNSAPVLVYVSESATAPGPPEEIQVFQLPSSPVAPSWPMLRKDAMGQAIAFSTTAEAAFVTTAFQVLQGRAPTPGELSYYVNAITSKQLSHFDVSTKLGWTSTAAARYPGKLNVSDTDTTSKLTSIYNTSGLPSVPADSLAAFLYQAHRGLSYLDAAILVVATGGNFAAMSGQASWAFSIYRDIFNVTPNASTVAGIVRQLDSGQPLQSVVKGLLNSPDARKGYVISQVQLLLGRKATSADFWMTGYASREDVVIAILAGSEFFAKSGSTNAGFVTAAYTATLGFAPQGGNLSTLVGYLNSGAITRLGLAKQLVTGTSGQFYLNNLVVAWLFKFTPDASKGDLRARLGSGSNVPDNPDPRAVSFYTSVLVSGGGKDEDVLAALMTAPQYLTDASYLRGMYVSPGIRV